MEPGGQRDFGHTPKGFPRTFQGTVFTKRGRNVLALSKLKRNLPVCYSHSSTNGKAGLAGFQIRVLAKHVGKHKLHTHCSGCSPGTVKIQSSERTAKGSGTKRGSNFSCSSAAVCAGGGRPGEEEQRMQQQSSFTEGELSLLSGKAAARAVQGGCSPRTQTCSQNKTHVKHRKSLFDAASCSRQDFGCLPRGVLNLLLCVPALYPLPVHLTLWLSSAAFVNSFCKQLKLFLL